ncbi:AAA family ATPase [Micromonospora carbonacea]|uniref:helix-turn-helix transcriptional regulator n=1 Tax=Micromonospora carbonacea TaxID=47853 RepID=UPI003327E34D
MYARATAVVGRNTELGVIHHAVDDARSGRGGAVFVTGEAGVGKSRLADAAVERALSLDMCVLRGRGSAIGPILPFRCLTELLLSLRHSGQHVDIGELGPYRQVLSRLVPDWHDDDATGGASESLVIIAEAVLRLTALVARDHGCMLVLDDLHEADAESLAVFEYLIHHLGRHATLLVAACRADSGTAPALARSSAQRRLATLVRLRPLSRAALRELTASCLETPPGGVPESVVDLLWAGSAGNPLHAEELLNDLCEGGVLRRTEQGWEMGGPVPVALPMTLAPSLSRRLDLLSAEAREVLSVAAVLGHRFPLEVVQALTGLDDRDLLGHFSAGSLAAHLVTPDEQHPDWYAFHHPLLAESLLAMLPVARRALLSSRAADAVERLHPGLPGEWCQQAATLRLGAGDRVAAGRLFTEAGRRALTQGAARSAVTLLERAQEALAADGDVESRADAQEALLFAYVEVGQVDRALASVEALSRLGGGLDRRRRSEWHTRLAWAAVVAGRSGDAQAQVDAARALLGPDPDLAASVRVDAVEAHLMLNQPGSAHVAAEVLARRAVTVAETIPLPDVACQVWQLLGALSRIRDPAEATACLERARVIAVRHGLPIAEAHVLVRLGNDEALHSATLDRLDQARDIARRIGAVTVGYQAESSVALHLVLMGRYAEAQRLIDRILPDTVRLNLLETTQYLLLSQAMLAAHQGRRRPMEAALGEFKAAGGDLPLHMPRVFGLVRAFCALLEEDRLRAVEDLERGLAAEARSPTIFPLSGRHGLDLLLRALAGELDEPSLRSLTSAPASRLRWDRQFSLLAGAVLAGRAGQAEAAGAAVSEVSRLAEPYEMTRHLAMRLVAEAALADGWGTPVAWLRSAEEYFHGMGVTPVASACRAMLRRAGASVGQRRRGIERIPAELRSAGVTVREFEILRLLRERLGNREIAERLHLSPRTVEKHVASLLVKTGQPSRLGLSQLAL